LRGGARERVERAVDAVVHERSVRARALLHARAWRRRLVAAVLPCQPAAGEWAERLVRDAVLVTQRQQLLLVTAIEERVRVLHERRLADGERRAHLVRRDVADPVRADDAALDELLERADRLLDRRVRIGRMREVEIDAIDSQPLEARVDLTEDAVATEPVVLAGVHWRERLRRDRRAVAGRSDPLADRRLAATAAVRVSRVEGRETERPRRVHDREGLLVRLARAEELGGRSDPAEVAAAEDDSFESDAGRAELTLLHRAILRSARARFRRVRVPARSSRAAAACRPAALRVERRDRRQPQDGGRRPHRPLHAQQTDEPSRLPTLGERAV